MVPFTILVFHALNTEYTMSAHFAHRMQHIAHTIHVESVNEFKSQHQSHDYSRFKGSALCDLGACRTMRKKTSLFHGFSNSKSGRNQHVNTNMRNKFMPIVSVIWKMVGNRRGGHRSHSAEIRGENPRQREKANVKWRMFDGDARDQLISLCAVRLHVGPIAHRWSAFDSSVAAIATAVAVYNWCSSFVFFAHFLFISIWFSTDSFFFFSCVFRFTI